MATAFPSGQAPLDLQWFGRDQRSVQIACPTAGWRIYVAVDGGSGSGRYAAAPEYGETIISRGENVSILVRGKGTDPVSGRRDVFVASGCTRATTPS